MAGRAYIGTSGWTYTRWRGDFFPQDLPQRRWLPYLADRLTSVEVNGTFYRFPTPRMVRPWAEAVPRDFRIAIKLWRGITHYRKLTDSERYLSDFYDHIDVIPTRQRAPILIQLPPNQGKDLDKLDAFLRRMKRVAGRRHWKRAVEFRDPGWYDEDTYDLLDRHRTALCLHDMTPRGPVDRSNDASFVYMRRHGPGGDTGKGYTARHIRRDAQRVRTWLDEGRMVFVYYNNDVNGDAPHDARRLLEAVDGAPRRRHAAT